MRKPHHLRSLIAAVFFLPVTAQILLDPAGNNDFGTPPRPPFITLLGIVSPGTIATDASLRPKGPVAEVLYEQLRGQTTRAGQSGELIRSVRTRYDGSGRAVEIVRKERGAESDTVNHYEGQRLVSQETTFSNPNISRPKFWIYWSYDPSGKLIEFRRGSGNEIQNHLTNTRRDAQGRLVSFDFRQGPKDALFSRTEYRYSEDGKTAECTEYDAAGAVFRSTTQTVDDKGRIATAVIHEYDWKTKKPNAPVTVSFRYDSQVRLVEQKTDAPEVKNENELPPGAVSIEYDDVKHTKTTTYKTQEGTMSSTLTYDDAGGAIAALLKVPGETTDWRLNCTFDNHQNWISCERVVDREGALTVTEKWRRTITYRKSQEPPPKIR